jgi:hypothetical protein
LVRNFFRSGSSNPAKNLIHAKQCFGAAAAAARGGIMRKHVIALTALIVVGVMILTAAYAADDEVLLGTQSLEPNSKRIVIQVDKSVSGKFAKLRFTAEGQDMEIFKIRVFFSGGRDWELMTRMPFSGENRQQFLDLPGGTHKVKKVVLFYRLNGPANGDKAEVQVFGIR